MKRSFSVAVLAIAGVTAVAPAWGRDRDAGFARAWGDRFQSSAAAADDRARPTRPPVGLVAWIRHWNQIAIDASGLDHTPVAPGESRVFGEQLGPGRSSRAMAIVHVAIFEVVNAMAPKYQSLVGLKRSPGGTSKRAAIAQAAHDTLVALYPSQATAFDQALADELGEIRDGKSKSRGVELGRRAASAVLALRAGDHSDEADPRMGEDYVPGDAPGVWRQDPISQVPIALGAHWGEVRPLVIPSGDAFRVPPPPALDSAEYAAAYDEVKRLGAEASTERTDDQTLAGIYWAYDGMPSLCAPPRLYNLMTVHIAEQMRTPAVELARLLALVNVAMADAGIAVWESKYHYAFWRPITGIRESDPGTGPTGAGDGNPATIGDPSFVPLGAQTTNLTGPNFTPPFPAYPSGHAGFGGALFQTLRRFYRRDDVRFTFVSEELNGVTVDNNGHVRPLAPRTFSSFSQAEEENGQSRIYLGIHWAFDKTEGIAQGRQVADYVFDHAFAPAR